MGRRLKRMGLIYKKEKDTYGKLDVMAQGGLGCILSVCYI